MWILIPFLVGVIIVFVFHFPFYYHYLLIGSAFLALSFIDETERKAVKIGYKFFGSLFLVLGILYIIA
ncbi:hypothetical protein C6I21_01285 [Alkalicoccus urumqiensis]|uniref:DUF3953 domain-containing protein n=1 Tax=Alkalicoccus urumqiensis TaxID=1548213 RepID=A0A2P6MLS1_ALKUR|nr:hypothetical protein C6I21_01285 [Alkalicoccus urumqiensis]